MHTWGGQSCKNIRFFLATDLLGFINFLLVAVDGPTKITNLKLPILFLHKLFEVGNILVAKFPIVAELRLFKLKCICMNGKVL